MSLLSVDPGSGLRANDVEGITKAASPPPTRTRPFIKPVFTLPEMRAKKKNGKMEPSSKERLAITRKGDIVIAKWMPNVINMPRDC